MPENPIAEFYKLFGLTQTASIDEIIQARRFLALEFHPDRGGSDEHMALVNLAFDEIMNWHRQQQPEPLHISIPKVPRRLMLIGPHLSSMHFLSSPLICCFWRGALLEMWRLMIRHTS